MVLFSYGAACRVKADKASDYDALWYNGSLNLVWPMQTNQNALVQVQKQTMQWCIEGHRWINAILSHPITSKRWRQWCIHWELRSAGGFTRVVSQEPSLSRSKACVAFSGWHLERRLMIRRIREKRPWHCRFLYSTDPPDNHKLRRFWGSVAVKLCSVMFKACWHTRHGLC